MDNVIGVSWPRSGHHLLVRLLKFYFGDKMRYCDCNCARLRKILNGLGIMCVRRSERFLDMGGLTQFWMIGRLKSLQGRKAIHNRPLRNSGVQDE